MRAMDVNRELGTRRWGRYGFQAGVFPRSNQELPGQAYAFVTRAEMPGFQCGLCELIRLFLELHASSAIEPGGTYIDVYLN